MSSTPAIELRSVSVAFDGVEVLRDVSCALDARTIAVIGANGSGKSTFARLLNGLVTATSGHVRVFGLDPARDGRAVRDRVGFVFSSPAAQLLMPTVREDLAMSLRGRRLPRAEVAARVDAVLEASPLAGRGEQSVHALSSGQQQLLAVLGVQLVAPDLIVADEPTALLDLVNSRRIARLLLDDPARRLVLVTHDLELAARCEVALWFADGRLCAIGEPEDLIARYRAEAP